MIEGRFPRLRIFICSPLRGDVENNMFFAKCRCREEIYKGNLPIAPHLYFTQFLDDKKEEDRKLGIEMGLELMDMCDDLRVCGNKVTEGMEKEILYWINQRKVKQ